MESPSPSESECTFDAVTVSYPLVGILLQPELVVLQYGIRLRYPFVIRNLGSESHEHQNPTWHCLGRH